MIVFRSTLGELWDEGPGSRVVLTLLAIVNFSGLIGLLNLQGSPFGAMLSACFIGFAWWTSAELERRIDLGTWIRILVVGQIGTTLLFRVATVVASWPFNVVSAPLVGSAVALGAWSSVDGAGVVAEYRVLGTSRAIAARKFMWLSTPTVIVLSLLAGDQAGPIGWCIGLAVGSYLAGRFAGDTAASNSEPAPSAPSSPEPKADEPAAPPQLAAAPTAEEPARPPLAQRPNPAIEVAPSSTATYDLEIVSFGQVPAAQAAASLASRFGIPPRVAGQLVARLPQVVKRNVTSAIAESFAAELERLGASTRLKPTANTQSKAEPSPTPRAAPLPASSIQPAEAGQQAASSDRGNGYQPCRYCREPVDPGARVCPHCRHSLVVHLRVAAPVQDPRERYRLSRAAAERFFNGDFTRARKALESKEQWFAEGITPVEAAVLAERAQEIGLSLTAVSEPPPAPATIKPARNRLSRLAPIAAGLGLLLMGVADSLSHRSTGSASEIANGAMDGIGVLSCGTQMGSGFFIEEHLLVTNEHVLCRGSRVQVKLRNGMEATGAVKARDKRLDLALVQVELPGRPLPLGDSTELIQGEEVYLLGNPRGLEFTLTRGLVSHAHRAIGSMLFVQLDASVNSGNSGGPILSRQGEVVGVVTLRLNEADGMGFAVPVNYLYAEPTFGLEPPSKFNRVAWENLTAAGQTVGLKEREQALDHPALMDAACERVDDYVLCLTAKVALVSELEPARGNLSFAIEVDGERACRVAGEAARWNHRPKPSSMLKHFGLENGVYETVVTLQKIRCNAGREAQVALVVSNGLQGYDRVEVPQENSR